MEFTQNFTTNSNRRAAYRFSENFASFGIEFEVWPNKKLSRSAPDGMKFKLIELYNQQTMWKVIIQIIKYKASIDHQTESLNPIIQAISAINGFLLLFTLLTKRITAVFPKNAQQIVQFTYEILHGETPDSAAWHILLGIYGIGFVISISSLVMVVVSCKKIATINRKNIGSRLIYYFPLFFFLLCQVLYCPTCWHLVAQINHFSQLTIIQKTSVFFVGVVYGFITVLNFKNRLYSFCLAIIAGAIGSKISIFYAIFKAVISLVFLVKQAAMVRRFFYAAIIYFVVINNLEIGHNDSSIKNVILSIVILVLLLLLCCTQLSKSITSSDLYEENLRAFKIIRRIKNEADSRNIREAPISADDMFFLEQLFMKFTSDYAKIPSMELQNFLNKQVVMQLHNVVDLERLVQKFDTKFGVEANHTKRFELLKIWYSFRLSTNHRISEVFKSITKQISRQIEFAFQEAYNKAILQIILSRHILQKQFQSFFVQNLQQIDARRDKFNQSLVKICQHLCHVWSKNSAESGLVEDKIIKCIEEFEQMDKNYKALSSFQYLQKQKDLMHKISVLLYSKPYQFQPPSAGLTESAEQKIYFVCQNEKIIRSSPRLLDITGLSKQQIIDNNIYSFCIRQAFSCSREAELQAQCKINAHLPIQTTAGFLVVLEGQVMVVPSCHKGLQYLFLFSHHKEQKSMYLLVDKLSASVTKTCQKFYESFLESQSACENQFELGVLKLKQFIEVDDIIDLKKQLELFKKIKCYFHPTIARGSLSLNKNLKGSIWLIENYENSYLIKIQVENASPKIESKGFDISSKNNKKQENQNLVEAENQSQLHCPINHPYKRKIESIKSTLTQGQNLPFFTYSVGVILCLVLILALSVAMIVGFYIMDENKNAILQDFETTVDKATGHSLNLIEACESVFMQYLVASEPVCISKCSGLKFDINQTLLDLQKNINEFLRQFRVLFRFFPQRNQIPESFQIIFKSFTVEANFAKTSFMDMSYNIKQVSQEIIYRYNDQHKVIVGSQADKKLLFLLDNYEQLANLQAPYEAINLIWEGIQNKQDIQMNFIIIFAVFFCLKFFLLCWFVAAQRKIVLKALNISQIFHQANLEQIWKQKFQGHLDNILEAVDKMHKPPQKHGKWDTSQSWSRSKSAIPSDNMKILTHTLSHLKLVLLMSLLIAVCIAVLQNQSKNNNMEEAITLDYYNQLKKMMYFRSKQSTELLHAILQERVRGIFEKTAEIVENKQSRVNISSDDSTRHKFEPFFAAVDEISKQDLCRYQIYEPLIGQVPNCSKIIFGVMRRGYVQTMESFDNIMRKVRNKQLQLFEVPNQETYPAVVIIADMKKKLQMQLQAMMKILKAHRGVRNISQSRNIKTIICSYAIILVLFTGYALFRLVPSIRKMKSIVAVYFNLIPEEMLLNYTVSDYLRSQNLLDRVINL